MQGYENTYYFPNHSTNHSAIGGSLYVNSRLYEGLLERYSLMRDSKASSCRMKGQIELKFWCEDLYNVIIPIDESICRVHRDGQRVHNARQRPRSCMPETRTSGRYWVPARNADASKKHRRGRCFLLFGKYRRKRLKCRKPRFARRRKEPSLVLTMICWLEQTGRRMVECCIVGAYVPNRRFITSKRKIWDSERQWVSASKCRVHLYAPSTPWRKSSTGRAL